ncbi:MAG: hypothetical protein U1F35_05225 [Steroidobacteraceae bacterium]
MTEEIRRKHPFTARCTSCGAEIVWFRTKKGNKMPVNEETTLPTDREDQLDLKRHKSHFATCPNSEQHRRPR